MLIALLGEGLGLIGSLELFGLFHLPELIDQLLDEGDVKALG